ncbi:MAG: hypothetical protein ABL949_16495 [Fimbriimonadaceae bacterium]
MVIKIGLAFLAMATLLFVAWGISAALIVQSWNPMTDDQVRGAFSFAGVMFRWPTYLMGGFGALCLILGVRAELTHKA